MLNVLALKDVQIKPTKRYCYIPIRVKPLTTPSVGNDGEHLELSYTAGENVKCHYHFGGLFGNFL